MFDFHDNCLISAIMCYFCCSFMLRNLFTTALICLLLIQYSFAQNRLSESNNIGWYTTIGNIKFTDKWSVHLEYQWRRNDFGRIWQQSLLRTGINYHLNDAVVFRLGYGWIETYPYGTYPLNSFGKQFTEHRIYQMINLSHKAGRVGINHRYMLEQRWLATYHVASSVEPDQWTFLNRLRYMGRLDIPIKGNTLDNKEPYLALYDEVFIGFGEKVGQNVFDQNRIGILFGWRFSPSFKIEGGYFNQIVQLGRQIGGKNVFQFNEGFIINTLWNLNLSKKD